MRAAILLLALGLSACSNSVPTAPTPPPAPPVSPLPSPLLSISLIGDMWIPTTSSGVQMTARLVTSTTPFEWIDGNDRVTWSAEPPGIVSVDRLGRVTPLSIGTATVRATLDGRTGTNSVRVLPDYSGTWNGEFIVSACSGGADPRECGRIMIGTGLQPIRYPFSLELSQFRDQISGTLRELRDATTRQPDIIAPVNGFVRLNGSLVLEATVPHPSHEPFRVANWSSLANPAATTMSGAFTQYEPRSTLMTPPYRYVIRTENEFVNIARAR